MLHRQYQRQQPCGIAGIPGRGAAGPGNSSGQLQGRVQADWAGQLADFAEALLEIDVRHFAELAGQPVLAPFLLQLAAVVVAPTGPAGQSRTMLGEPALEGFPDRIEMGCAIDVGLADMRGRGRSGSAAAA